MSPERFMSLLARTRMVRGSFGAISEFVEQSGAGSMQQHAHADLGFAKNGCDLFDGQVFRVTQPQSRALRRVQVPLRLLPEIAVGEFAATAIWSRFECACRIGTSGKTLIEKGIVGSHPRPASMAPLHVDGEPNTDRVEPR